MKLNEKIYQHRKELKMTQNDLAETLHVSRQAVSRWEMGASTPDVDNLKQLSVLFSVSVDYLITETETFKETVEFASSQRSDPRNASSLRTNGKYSAQMRRFMKMGALIITALLLMSAAIILIGYSVDSPTSAYVIVLSIFFVLVLITVVYLLIMLLSKIIYRKDDCV
jgi:transcriptional regulator with XRE-family HTH domain